MKEVAVERKENELNIVLSGRIDSGNAHEAEEAINEYLTDAPVAVTIDAEALEYISSAGLRVILRLKKDYPDIKIVGVNPEVYEIFDMTGFTDILNIE